MDNPVRMITFAQFWACYPKRKAKKDAEKAWNKIDPANHEKIMSCLPAHCRQDEWTKDDGTYIPYAATWLRGERWEDELEVEQPAKIVIRCAWPGCAEPHTLPGPSCYKHFESIKAGQHKVRSA